MTSPHSPASADVPVPADSPLLARGARLQKLAGGFGFSEGPAADAHGNVFFTDQPHDSVLRWDAVSGKLSTFLQPCGRANGLCFDARGDLWACADASNQLWRINPAGKAEVVVREYQGKRLNGPNDVWVRPDGGLYFTDPYYPRDYWKPERKQAGVEQSCEGVYFLTADGKTLTRVVSDLNKPNGIIGTPDGKSLYVSDIGAGKTFVYAIGKDGSLSGKRLFCAMGSDGMTIDDAGNVYLTGQGVTVFNADGRQALHVPVPENWTGNVCFGGANRQTLFITASTGFYSLNMTVRGVGSQ